MSNRPQPCLTCTPDTQKFGRRGFTRHKDRICAACRREARADARLAELRPLLDSELRRPDHYPGRGGW